MLESESKKLEYKTPNLELTRTLLDFGGVCEELVISSNTTQWPTQTFEKGGDRYFTCRGENIEKTTI